MGSVNKWIGIGNLGADPELKHTPSNKAVCNLRLACNEVFKDKSGQKQEKTEWVRVTVWGDTADNCAKYLAKGRLVYVEGRLQTRSYDKDGQKHYSTEIVSDRVVFLSSGRDGGGQSAGGDDDAGERPRDSRRGSGAAPAQNQGPPPGSDDDIPF